MEKPWFAKYPPGVKHVINPDQYTSVTQMLLQAASRHSDATALVNFGATLTYRQLDKLSATVATHLHQQGWKKGDCLAIMLPNCLQYPVILLAAWRLGITITNVNPLYTHHEVSNQCRDANVKGIVVFRQHEKIVCKAHANYAFEQVIVTGIADLFNPLKRTVVNVIVTLKFGIKRCHISHTTTLRHILKKSNHHLLPHIDVKPNDIALLQYTGGTTGKRKAAILSHRNLIANILQVRTWMLPILKNKQITTIVALPLYHIFSLTANLLTTLDIGAKNVLITDPRNLNHFVNVLRRYPFNILLGVNTLFNELLAHKNFHKINFSAPSVTLAGGMALQKATAKKWQEQTGRVILQGYGLTEASPAVTIAPLDETTFNGSIGVPIPSTDIQICDENAHPVAFGQIGELWIKGPQVMQGYWQNSEETEKVLTDDHWLHTGDMAYCDEAGYVYLVDRKHDLIIISGFNVYPNEIEDVIAQHPGVNEVAVIGVKTDNGNEQVKAFVVKNPDHPDVTDNDIQNYCHDWLTGYKIPKVIEFRDKLPKSTVGKILRRALREEQN